MAYPPHSTHTIQSLDIVIFKPFSTTYSAQKLNRAFHWISVQKSLLGHESQGLRQALNNERRRKRGKTLPFEQPNEYHGGPIVWSLENMKKPNDRPQQQEQDEKQQQFQKAEKARARDDQK